VLETFCCQLWFRILDGRLGRLLAQDYSRVPPPSQGDGVFAITNVSFHRGLAGPLLHSSKRGGNKTASKGYIADTINIPDDLEPRHGMQPGLSARGFAGSRRRRGPILESCGGCSETRVVGGRSVHAGGGSASLIPETTNCILGGANRERFSPGHRNSAPTGVRIRDAEIPGLALEFRKSQTRISFSLPLSTNQPPFFDGFRFHNCGREKRQSFTHPP
jgi:hypothetical protein